MGQSIPDWGTWWSPWPWNHSRYWPPVCINFHSLLRCWAYFHQYFCGSTLPRLFFIAILLNHTAYIQVYLAAIVRHVPSDMVKCVSTFLDFCYIACHNMISTKGLNSLQDALTWFHQYHDIFISTGLCTNISLPHQHSLIHCVCSICLFGSLNGLCSSITESKHIKAIKEPWQRSSHYHAMVQMLQTISQLDKLAATSHMFTKQGMMEGSTSSYMAMVLWGKQPQPPANSTRDYDEDEDEDHDLGPVSGPKVLSLIELVKTPGVFCCSSTHFLVLLILHVVCGYPHDIDGLAQIIHQPWFPEVLQHFLWDQLNFDPSRSPHDVPLDECPCFGGHINVYHSAVACFYAPSDLCSTGGMYHKRIQSTPNWHEEYPQFDTVFVETDAELPGMCGMLVGRVLLFFSFFSWPALPMCTCTLAYSSRGWTRWWN